MESSLEDFNPSGCTCPLTEIPISHDSSRYVVLGHTCPHCREWNRRIREAGVSESESIQSDREMKKRRTSKKVA
jgi:hypothetical protein